VAASNVIVEVTSGLITPQALAINQGDAVIWVFGQGNELDVRSYTGEWQSPFLGEGGTFSQTFTTPGEYVYGSHIKFGTIIGFNRGATIAVAAWTNSPPPITINSPVEGFFLLRGYQFIILASVTNRADEVSRVDFFANTNLIGTATNAPYRLPWTGQEAGQISLIARVTDSQGRQATSRPVNVTLEDVDVFGGRLWGIRRVINGVFVMHYNKGLGFQTCIRATDDLVIWHDYGFASTSGGIFVDEAANVGRRVYRIDGCYGGRD
jgi:hypothetical protein